MFTYQPALPAAFGHASVSVRRGLPGHRRHHPAAAFTWSPMRQLATVDAAYYQAVPSRGGFVRFGLFPAQYHDFLFLFINPLRLPRRQTEYMSASPGLVWVSQLWQSYQTLAADSHRHHGSSGPGSAWPRAGTPIRCIPGPTSGCARGQRGHVLPSASRQGNTLTLDITPFSDNHPGTSARDSSPGSAPRPAFRPLRDRPERSEDRRRERGDGAAVSRACGPRSGWPRPSASGSCWMPRAGRCTGCPRRAGRCGPGGRCPTAARAAPAGWVCGRGAGRRRRALRGPADDDAWVPRWPGCLGRVGPRRAGGARLP